MGGFVMVAALAPCGWKMPKWSGLGGTLHAPELNRNNRGEAKISDICFSHMSELEARIWKTNDLSGCGDDIAHIVSSAEKMPQSTISPTGRWLRSQAEFYPDEGAPEPALSLTKGPSLLGTGEAEPGCRYRIHPGNCQPLIRAVHSDSISTAPRTPV